jgi:truncated hemoglobin YjbI
VAADFPDPADPERRRRWLENLAAACERVLIRDAESTTDVQYLALREDTAKVLAAIRAELDSARP